MESVKLTDSVWSIIQQFYIDFIDEIKGNEVNMEGKLKQNANKM